MLTIDAAGLTDVGQKRDGNEDAFLVDGERRLYVVADGMGGHLAGEVASALVVDTFKESPLTAGTEQPQRFDETLSSEANRVLECIHAANRSVHEKSTADEQCRGMGATVSAVYCTNSTLIIANVGDSPIYLVRDGHVEQLSVPHTVAAEQAAIDPDRLALIGDKIKHMLTRAIGVSESVVPDVCEMPGFNNDVLIICSDGLSNLVNPEEIADISSQHEPPEACKKLVDLANERGGDDNITVIVIKLNKKPSRLQSTLLFFLKYSGLDKLINH
ncbi:MAG: serine/threonine-protein phosphatase [Deltaproteobacteria bacterium]|nr:serine/threonine-protein phosphatase [Deltaproteobacteria bacterium]